jgi:hypothetical protein
MNVQAAVQWDGSLTPPKEKQPERSALGGAAFRLFSFTTSPVMRNSEIMAPAWQLNRLLHCVVRWPAFVLLVAGALVIAPVGVLGLSWQRAGQGELNEERTEQPGSEQSRSSFHHVSRAAKGGLLVRADIHSGRIRAAMLASFNRMVAESHGALPSVDGWRLPLRC